MTRSAVILTALCLALDSVAGAPPSRPIPEGVALPLTIFAVDWGDQSVGHPPQRARKEFLEDAARDPWQTLPLRTYTHLDFVTRDRTAMVREAALGLNDQPVVFTAPDGRQPHWGPRMTFSIPPAIAAVGKQYRVVLDVSMANVTPMGGVSLNGVGAMTFYEDGSVHFGKTEIARYQPATPLHVEFVIDLPSRQCTMRVNGGEPLTTQWKNPKANRFPGLRLDGLLPGGHARAPGQLAFDNINIVLEK